MIILYFSGNFTPGTHYHLKDQMQKLFHNCKMSCLVILTLASMSFDTQVENKSNKE